MDAPFIARPARALAALWVLTAVLSGRPALLLRSFAEDQSARSAATVLLLTAAVALVAGCVVSPGTHRLLLVSLAASMLVLVAGGSAFAVLASAGHVGTAGGLMLGGFAVAGGAVTALVAGLRLRGRPAPPSQADADRDA